MTEMTLHERIDAALHRYTHRTPERCVTPEQAAQRPGYLGVQCLWGFPSTGHPVGELKAALAEHGLEVRPIAAASPDSVEAR